MEVRVISTDTIKPSSLTPPHLRTHKLSLLDQLNTDDYFPLIYFYSGESKNTTEISDHLKISLAKTLTRYYPFAGRVIDNFSVECDDSGATFIEAHVAKEMSEILNKQPEYDLLVQLLPFKDNVLKLYTDGILLVIQVNYFSCGGVAIGVYFNHVVADAAAATTFIQCWAAIACGANYSKNVIYNCTSIFPPRNLQVQVKDLIGRIYEKCDSLGEAISKRFTFHDTKIAALRERIHNGDYFPTRIEAISALILGAMTADQSRDDLKKTNVAFIAVNLTKRMNPPLPKQYIGNICLGTMAKWSTGKIIGYNSLAGKIHESIASMDDSYIRKVNKDSGHSFLNGLTSLDEENNKLNLINLSSLCRFPLYDSDFGWGKPKWVSMVMKYNNTIILTDTCNGEGIEAWVGLPKEDMAKFENNHDILAYASNPTIL